MQRIGQFSSQAELVALSVSFPGGMDQGTDISSGSEPYTTTQLMWSPSPQVALRSEGVSSTAEAESGLVLIRFAIATRADFDAGYKRKPANPQVRWLSLLSTYQLRRELIAWVLVR